jgi:ATP-binding cassette subfamily F protein uup
LIVVTHDRWFLDAVDHADVGGRDGAVEAYEGGYAAYVLAQAPSARTHRRR